LPGKRNPLLLVFAGPNGAGKTTISRRLQAGGQLPKNYVNADDIGRKLGINDLCAANEADRQRADLIQQRKSFATETVLSTDRKIKLMEQAKAAGYTVVLVYVTTQSADINVDRVEKRRLEGEHYVPEDKVRSRYQRGTEIFHEAFRIADAVEVYDNSEPDAIPKLIAEKKDGKVSIYPVGGWSRDRIKNLIYGKKKDRISKIIFKGSP